MTLKKNTRTIIILKYVEYGTPYFHHESFVISRKKFHADNNVKLVSTASGHLRQSHQSHGRRSQRAKVENQ